jgi:hypothetical protein
MRAAVSDGALAPEAKLRTGLRVKGRAVMLRRLAALRIAVHRFAQYRAVTDDDRRWAQRVADALDVACKAAWGQR